jgi:predicted RND superfamily exporter protein
VAAPGTLPRMVRYAAWLDRARAGVLVLTLLVGALALLAITRLELRSDMSSLLPPSQRSVQDLEVVRHRARAFGNVLVAVEAPTVAQRQVAAAKVQAALESLPPSLVTNVATDAGALPRYIWEHRFQLAPLDDLRAAKEALTKKLAEAKADANPLLVDFDDEDDEPASAATATPAPPGSSAPPDPLAALEQRLRDAEADSKAPRERLSFDGLMQLFTVTASFQTSEAERGRALMDAITRAVAAQQLDPAVQVHYTGTIRLSLADHESVISGMALAAIITILLCAIALLAYYKTVWGVGAALLALAVGVLATFAVTAATIGHLNLMSAFLTAIVIGNGINPGLLVLARFLEELRATGGDARAALAPALAGALRGTVAAALTAAVAYASLMITDFRGFRHFGFIACVGMLLCWVAAFTVLPTLLLILGGRGKLRVRPEPGLGRWLARALMWRPRALGALGIAVAIFSAVVSTVYIARDPFAKDWRGLQADGGRIDELRAFDQRLRDSFGRTLFNGMSYQLVAAVPSVDDAGPLVERLRAIEAARPKDRPVLMEIRSLADLVPRDEAIRLPLLTEIRDLLDDMLAGDLSEAEVAQITRLRPPTDLRPLTVDDVPAQIRWPFVERDGTSGKLVTMRGSPRFEAWNVADRLEFAAEVRKLPLPAGTALAGEPLIIADIVKVMKRDTPWMIGLAFLGSMLAIFLVVGRGRHAWATAASAVAGIAAMIALCAAVELDVHFLDLIALPITIGIGIDYAVNLASRDREEPGRGAYHILSTTGGAVLLCSFTTTVGYASLLLSSNGGVRSFGLGAILGEVACLGMALVLVPLLLRPRTATPVTTSTTT